MDKNIKRRIAIEGLIFLPVLLIASIAIASGEFGIGLFLIIIYAIVRFVIWSMKALEGKDRIKETKVFEVLVDIFWFIVVFAIIIFIISTVKKSISRYSAKNAEKAQIALQEKWEAEERKTEEAQIALQKKIEAEEKENAKQIEVVNWSSGDKQQNLLNLLRSQIRVTLKNNSYDIAERIDAIVTYYTPNNYKIKDEILTDITGGGVLPPKSTIEFTKAITLDAPKQEFKMGLKVSKVKFKESYYTVIKEKFSMKSRKYSTQDLVSEMIWRYYSWNECQQEVNSSKQDNNVLSVECRSEDDHLWNMFHNKATSEWYVRTIMQSGTGVIVQFINLYPNYKVIQIEENKKISIETFLNYLVIGTMLDEAKFKTTKVKVYTVSPEGKVTLVWDTFDGNGIQIELQDEELKKLLADFYNELAYKLYTNGVDLEKGLKLIDWTLEKYPNDGIYLSTKAELLYKLGRYDAAYDYIKKGISIEPNNPEIQKDFKMIEDALNKKKKR